MIRALIEFLLALLGRRPDQPSAPAAPAPVGAPAPAPVRAAPVLSGVDLAPLMQPHGAFDSRSTWCLTRDGFVLNGKAPRGTPGEPLTARAALSLFSIEFRAAASEFGVPIELLVACACTETGVDIRRGRDAARAAERHEPGFTSYAASPHRVSIGVMQTLLSTARSALHDPLLQPVDLRSPSTSIRAGAAYMASQRRQTRYDPPLVAAAYNAGGVYDDPVPGLPFSLRDFPAGEDRHVERFCQFFNDAWAVLREDPRLTTGVPSFVRVLS